MDSLTFCSSLNLGPEVFFLHSELPSSINGYPLSMSCSHANIQVTEQLTQLHSCEQDCVCTPLAQRPFSWTEDAHPPLGSLLWRHPRHQKHESDPFTLLLIFVPGSLDLSLSSLSSKIDYGNLKWCYFTLFF